jgi:N-acetylmuramoyl-L-alanine amidase
MAVPAARAASNAIVLKAPQRYDMVGAKWRDGTVRLRGRAAHGRWSPWQQLESGDPVWAGGYDYVQLRTSGRLSRLRLHFVRIQRMAHAAARTVPVPGPGGSTLNMVPRSAWGASRCKPRATAGYGRVDFGIVHHTTTLNGYRRSDSPAIVLGVCLFHRNVNGWNDIGYNMLVDKFGQIFEGRAGGIDEPVVGAQAGGFNLWSAGVATLGNYSYRQLPAAGMDALAHVLAWKLSLSGVPAEGQVKVISNGGPDTPFRAGSPVTVNRISGHRDVDSTACPGAALYAQLPQLRRQVAALEGPVSQLTLTTPSAVLTFPQQLVLSGKLTPPAGLAIPAGATVQIQDRLAAGGRTIATLPLAPDGSYSGSLPLPHNDVVRALYTGDGTLPRVAAAPVRAFVVPVVTLQASPPANSAVTLTGTVAPAKRRVIVEEQRLRKGAFKRVRLIRAGVVNGAFRLDVKLPKPGSYRFIARVPADRLTALGASAPVAVTAG